MNTVRVRYENGVLIPLEPLDLEEGIEVTVSLEDGTGEVSDDAPTRKRGLAAIVERVKARHEAIPQKEWENIPTDLAKNYKHYLYGHPKEKD